MSADEPSTRDPVQSTVIGVAAGAATGGAAAACVAPVVAALGFTAEGIAAGSAAAGMMSASAITSGGGVAAGSAVAVMQSIGAVGLASGVALGLVGGGAVLGGATLAIVQCFRSGQHEYVSAYEPAPDRGQCWVVATEEGWGNVRTCRYSDEASAREAFAKIWCARILYSPEGEEVTSAGPRWAHNTIRRVMRDNYYTAKHLNKTEHDGKGKKHAKFD